MLILHLVIALILSALFFISEIAISGLMLMVY